MSQQTSIVFFTTSRIKDIRESIATILTYVGMTFVDATRFDGIDESWRSRHKNYVSLDYDFAGKRVNPIDLAKLYENGKLLLAQGVSEVQQEVRKAIEDKISPEVHGSALPQNTSIQIGKHDIFESMEIGKGQFFGQATLSITFWGYRHPPLIGAYRESILKLPIIQDIRSNLGKINRSFECRIYMS